MDTVLFIVGFIACLFIYLIPTFIAGANHKQKNAIFALNIFLGWTLIGWVICLVWALIKPSPSAQA